MGEIEFQSYQDIILRMSSSQQQQIQNIQNKQQQQQQKTGKYGLVTEEKKRILQKPFLRRTRHKNYWSEILN